MTLDGPAAPTATPHRRIFRYRRDDLHPSGYANSSGVIPIEWYFLSFGGMIDLVTEYFGVERVLAAIERRQYLRYGYAGQTGALDV